MARFLAFCLFAAGLALASGAIAQEPKVTAAPTSAKAAPAPKVGKDQKVCRHRFPDGKSTTWVCQKEQPCCAWDEIRYVKCGSTITRCL